MKFTKNNIIENQLKDFEDKYPWQSFKIRWKVKIESFFVHLRYRFSIKSPCCNAPMGNKKVFPKISQEPIYNCSKCNKKWF